MFLFLKVPVLLHCNSASYMQAQYVWACVYCILFKRSVYLAVMRKEKSNKR